MAEAVEKMEKKKEEENMARSTVEGTRARKVYTPRVDIFQRKDDIVVVADMPGVDEKSVDITLEKNSLTIYGGVEPEKREDGELTHREYGVGNYRRAFTLSEEIDREGITATIRHGTLRLVLPKAKAAKTRKIEVTEA